MDLIINLRFFPKLSKQFQASISIKEKIKSLVTIFNSEMREKNKIYGVIFFFFFMFRNYCAKIRLDYYYCCHYY